jgi:hypothetical protein
MQCRDGRRRRIKSTPMSHLPLKEFIIASTLRLLAYSPHIPTRGHHPSEFLG